MRSPLHARRSASRLATCAVILLAACGGSGADDDSTAAAPAESGPETVDAAADAPGSRGTDLDRRLFEQKMQFARDRHLDTLPIGDIMVEIGQSFIGTPYQPGTLEQDGPERLVVNLRALDCVTFVENVFALARVVRAGDPTFDKFLHELQRIRYRGGELNGYPSRLHYFSEWISDNENLGLVRNVTRSIGGVRDTTRIDFMTTHVDAYPAFRDTAAISAIRKVEQRLSAQPRYFVPQDRVTAAMDDIQNGDILAMTSTIAGLDVAHTGIALRRDGKVWLLNAPLVGDSVQISDKPIDERLKGISKQDGLMVARPL